MDSEVIQARCAGMYIADKTHLFISDGTDIGYSSIFRALKMRYLQCCVQNANDLSAAEAPGFILHQGNIHCLRAELTCAWCLVSFVCFCFFCVREILVKLDIEFFHYCHQLNSICFYIGSKPTKYNKMNTKTKIIQG